MVEYEALINGLHIAPELGIQQNRDNNPHHQQEMKKKNVLATKRFMP
jgi:hypothetical protein